MSSDIKLMKCSNSEKSDDDLERRKSKHYKAARLVVRNLPFTCKEDDVQKHFAEFGPVEEVTLLKKNGRLVGCGFVQFSKKLNAAEALNQTSGKPFLGRPIIVDWAVPKNTFHSIKYEKEKKESTSYKDENLDKRKDKPLKKQKSRSTVSQDPLDGKTIFLKNIPFQTTNENLQKCAETLAGPVEYAVICIDPLSQHSKGTGFVRFKEKDVADKVLNNDIQLILMGKQLSSHKMLSKENLEKVTSDKTTIKDKRNLYLIKEGVILAGSFAAKGVSQSDMSKRLLLEQQKSKALRNLHKFISPTRLVIYNLPFKNFDNKRLLTLFKSHSPPGAIINEARVMRNLNNLDEKGVPVSRGYGFVSFEKHEDALSALRTINNNPKIFLEKKRPIVSFSIEDKKALLIKKRRQEKSILKNHENEKNKDKSTINKSNNTSEEESKGDKIPSEMDPINSSISQLSKSKKKSKIKKNFKYKKSITIESSSSGNFVGLSSKQGKVKLPSKHKLRNQAAIHKVNVKKDLRKKKIFNNKLSRKQKRLKKQSNSI